MTSLLVVGALMLAAQLSAEPGALVEVETLDGHTSTGELVSFSLGEVVVQSAADRKIFPIAQLLAVRFSSQPASSTKLPSVWIELTDGSTLLATRFSVAEGEAMVTAIDGSELALPTRSIATVKFKQQDAEITKQWGRILQADTAGDLIVVHKKKAIDYLEGVLSDVSAWAVHFKIDGDEIAVSRAKVEGLVYYHGREPNFAELTCVVTSVGGIRFKAQSAALVGDRLHVVSVSGIEWKPRIASLRQIDFSAGKVQYLSDLEPESVRWTPYFAVPGDSKAIAQFGRPRRDASREGGPLQLGGKQYRKGLALLSHTEIVYRLPKKFRWFLTTAGIDDRVGRLGHVRLVIHGDERKLFDEALRGGDDPLPLRLDVEGVKRLKIVVEYGDDMDVADHLDLGDARVSK